MRKSGADAGQMALLYTGHSPQGSEWGETLSVGRSESHLPGDVGKGFCPMP